MKKLLIGTRNKGKLGELTSFFSDLPLELVSPIDLGITEDVEEIGKNYKENSQLKALFYAKKSGLPAVADDGGIEIDFLDGAPGLHSRRWLGNDSSDEAIIKKMTKLAKTMPDNKRKAYFRDALSLALPSGKMFTVYGEVEGIIAKKPLLKFIKGYPYRSFFYLPQIKKYYHESELTPDEQSTYNHRYKAAQKLKRVIKHVILSETKNLDPSLRSG